MGKPLKKDEFIRIDLFDRSFDFIIDKCVPKLGFVNEKTKIIISDKPAKTKRTKKITYEDIGGLREEVKKIREMVELPMRYPELFDN